jgi:Fe-S-cluster containining protein
MTYDSGNYGEWPNWFAAARRAEIDAALRGLYESVDGEVRGRGPMCWQSGRCCDFERFGGKGGHRLYVTGLEIAWCVQRADASLNRADGGEESAGTAAWGRRLTVHGACPFQVERACGVHALRPLGCRVFFCQRGTADWQHELYERFLGELRSLHDRWGIAYRYMEWRTGLMQAADVGRSTLGNDPRPHWRGASIRA